MRENVQKRAKAAPSQIVVLVLLTFFILPELDVPVIGAVIRATLRSTGIALPWGMALTTLFFLTSNYAQTQLTRLPAWFLSVFTVVALYLFLQALLFATEMSGYALRAVIATLSAPIIVVGAFVIAPHLPWRFIPSAMLAIFVLSFGVFLNQILDLRLNNFIVENWTEVWIFHVLPAYKSLGFGLEPAKSYTPTIASEASHEVYTYLTILIMGYVAMRRQVISRLAWYFTLAAFLFVLIHNGSRTSLFIIVIAAVIFYLLNLLASYKQNIFRTIFYILMPVVGVLLLFQIPFVSKLVSTVYSQWQLLQIWAEIYYEGKINADALQIVVGPRFYPLAVHIQTPLHYPIGLPINTSIEEFYQFSLQKLDLDPLRTTHLLLQQYVGNREFMNETAKEALVVNELVTRNEIHHTLRANLIPRTWLTYAWTYLGIVGYLITVALFAYSAFVAYLLFKRNELTLAAVLLTIVIAFSVSTGVGATQLFFTFGLLCAVAHGHLHLPPRNASGKFLRQKQALPTRNVSGKFLRRKQALPPRNASEKFLRREHVSR